MTLVNLLFSALFCLIGSISSYSQQAHSNLKIVGAMKNVMWKGQLFGIINLDTLSNKEHLYGLGPVEYLTGEILILDGKAYKSTVVSDSSMKVEETFQSKAPFFGYAAISNWTEQLLPDSIQSGKQLEDFLRKTQLSKGPFFFQLKGNIENARIHIVNLPKGSRVNSPEEAHRGQTNFSLEKEEVTILGFFSEKHQSIFTHHDTYLHMHLITSDKQKMGHLDDFLLQKGTVKLCLPTQ